MSSDDVSARFWKNHCTCFVAAAAAAAAVVVAVVIDAVVVAVFEDVILGENSRGLFTPIFFPVRIELLNGCFVYEQTVLNHRAFE